MKTRTAVLGAALMAAALVGVAILRSGEGEKRTEIAGSAAGPSAPPRAAASPPATQAGVRKPISPTATIASAVRLPATDSFESSSNLRALADTLEAALKNGDATAARLMEYILNECTPLILQPGYPASFRSRLANLAPEQQATALTHINRAEQRCADIARTEKITLSRMRDLQQRAMAVDDLVALAQRIAGDPASLSPAERADAVRRIISSRHGEAIYALADAMAFSDDADNFLLRRHAGTPSDIFAWKFVGCAYGAPCGPDSSFLRNNCISLGQCMPGGYREYVRYYWLSPYNYAAAVKAEQDILGLIASGRIEEILY